MMHTALGVDLVARFDVHIVFLVSSQGLLHSQELYSYVSGWKQQALSHVWFPQTCGELHTLKTCCCVRSSLHADTCFLP